MPETKDKLSDEGAVAILRKVNTELKKLAVGTKMNGHIFLAVREDAQGNPKVTIIVRGTPVTLSTLLSSAMLIDEDLAKVVQVTSLTQNLIRSALGKNKLEGTIDPRKVIDNDRLESEVDDE